MDTMAYDSQTPLYKASKGIALLNNCICYGIICNYVYAAKIFYQNHCQYSIDCRTNVIILYEKASTVNKIYSFLSMCSLLLVIFMIFINHKFRSKSNPKLSTIKLWLMVHGIAFFFILVFFTLPSAVLVKTEYAIMLIGFTTGIVLAYEICIVKRFSAEKRRNISDVVQQHAPNDDDWLHNDDETDQISRLAVAYSLAFVPYFLWIFFFLRKRMFPTTTGVPSTLLSSIQ